MKLLLDMGCRSVDATTQVGVAIGDVHPVGSGVAAVGKKITEAVNIISKLPFFLAKIAKIVVLIHLGKLLKSRSFSDGGAQYQNETENRKDAVIYG